MVKPTIVFVGAQKGGVGKTTITRVLLDYMKDNNIKPSVYDTEGALNKFYPYAKLVDIEKSAGQMQIFDGIEQAGMTVVDMKAGVMVPVLKVMHEAGKLDKSAKGDERTIMLHILGSDTQSLSEIKETNNKLGDAVEHYLVENHIGDGHFFKWNKAVHDTYFDAKNAGALLVVPHLDAQAMETVDLRKQSFTNFIRNEKDSDGKKNSDWMVRLVRHWRSEIYIQLDKLGLKQ